MDVDDGSGTRLRSATSCLFFCFGSTPDLNQRSQKHRHFLPSGAGSDPWSQVPLPPVRSSIIASRVQHSLPSKCAHKLNSAFSHQERERENNQFFA